MANKLNINKNTVHKRVLVAPLDWGLGHTTRCIPIITKLLKQKFEVILAAENASAALLTKEFPTLKILPLKGYSINYSKNPKFFLGKLLLQFPKIARTIKQENDWLKKVITDHKIDTVISDNRFGLYNKNIKCIYITHQLQIKTGFAITDKIAQKIHYSFINKFGTCWVPDNAGNENLAGELSHPKKMPNTPVQYISTVSRFENAAEEIKNDVLVILSGPEPQRTIFENKIVEQLKEINKRIVLVRGLPTAITKLQIDGVVVYNHLAAKELNKLVLESKVVIARSGYTTIMDMAKLQKKLLYVPTEGQTEQVYLAKYLAQKNYCLQQSQKDFNLAKALSKINSFAFKNYPTMDDGMLDNAIIKLL